MIGWIVLLISTGALMWVTVSAVFDRQTPLQALVGKGALALLWGATAFALLIRFTQGLGPVSGMSDRFPWGIWIGLDVLSGVALAAGGYTVTATVHIFNIERFKPILKPTVLTAFLGYILVAVALLIDVGRPYRMWHPLVMWQHHSIMFEVAWCVTLYTAVLAIEFSPVIFERLGMTKVLKLHHMMVIPLVIVGVVLSTLHQSSLGSMFLIVPEKLYPLWYSPLLPVFFLVSSVAVGMSMTIVESFFSSKVFGQSLEEPILRSLGRTASTVLFLYLFVKIVDVTARQAWGYVFSSPFQGVLFVTELFAGVFLPAMLLTRRTVLTHPRKLLGSALLIIGGVVLNRLNVSWFGMIPYSGWAYVPSWMELAITLSFVTVGAVVFGLAVRYLPIFPKEKSPQTSTT
ncbi:MAG: Ni/Fe-hydrogenase cytochrome b subunit [Pseudomonadota bacterium]